MIRFEHVTRTYQREAKPALDDVSVEFNRGDFVFLIGASGSGKSTLLRMILREGLPQTGKVSVAGKNLVLMVERRVPEYRRSIGMVFQDFRLLPDKTVFENVAFAMRVTGASRGEIRKRVPKILERVKLDHLAKRFPHEISGGEQQRTAIARAIVNRPAIVLADEPTGNLDPRASEEVMKILRWINASGTTVVMATHDRVIVDKMRRRVVQLHNGRLVRDEERGVYDPPEGSQAWEILAAEQAESGLRASDPMPLLTEAVAIVPAADETQAPAQPQGQPTPAEGGATAPESSSESLRIREYQVTFPEDEDDDVHEEPPAEVDAAELPDFGDDTDPIEALPQAPSARRQEPAQFTTPAPAPTQSRLDWLAHQPDPQRPAPQVPEPERAEPAAAEEPASRAEPAAGPPPSAGSEPADTLRTPDSPESSGPQPAPSEPDQSEPAAAEPAPSPPRPVPRPRSSAGESTYTDSQHTADQIRASKRGLFRRRRR